MGHKVEFHYVRKVKMVVAFSKTSKIIKLVINYAWINIQFSIQYYAIAFKYKIMHSRVCQFVSSPKEFCYLVIKQKPYWLYILGIKQIPRFGVKGT